jgi:hypothetical protein
MKDSKAAPSKRERIAKHPAKVLTFESMDPVPEDSDNDSSDPFPIRERDPAGRSSDPAHRYANSLITTRRFCARPAFVLFGAIGFSSP